jgi:hypothetical protein
MHPAVGSWVGEPSNQMEAAAESAHHLANAREKLGAANRAEAAAKLRRCRSNRRW